jgi:hypothetical protein
VDFQKGNQELSAPIEDESRTWKVRRGLGQVHLRGPSAFWSRYHASFNADKFDPAAYLEASAFQSRSCFLGQVTIACDKIESGKSSFGLE